MIRGYNAYLPNGKGVQVYVCKCGTAMCNYLTRDGKIKTKPVIVNNNIPHVQHEHDIYLPLLDFSPFALSDKAQEVYAGNVNTHTETFTVDPPKAKCLEDALSVSEKIYHQPCTCNPDFCDCEKRCQCFHTIAKYRLTRYDIMPDSLSNNNIIEQTGLIEGLPSKVIGTHYYCIVFGDLRVFYNVWFVTEIVVTANLVIDHHTADEFTDEFSRIFDKIFGIAKHHSTFKSRFSQFSEIHMRVLKNAARGINLSYLKVDNKGNYQFNAPSRKVSAKNMRALSRHIKQRP